jgi:hypothetical protein
MRGNLIRQIGASGISVGYLRFQRYERYPDSAYIPVDVVIEDNVLDGIGLELRTNNGMTIYHAKRARITHNFIRNTAYCGLAINTSFVWNPQYEEGNTIVGDHLVSGNLIVDSGRELYDAAPIYMLYRNCGKNLITRNCVLIDELGRHGNMCGIYLDEGCTNYTVTQNVVDVPYNTHGGWMYINQREPRLPRILNVHENYTTNEYLGKEPSYSDTLDGTIANDSYRIYVDDTHCRRASEAWPAEAVEVVQDSGPRQTRFAQYPHVLKSYKDKILKVQDEVPHAKWGHYDSYALKGDNLVPNGDFESGSHSPWYPTGCEVEVTDEAAYEGKYCLKVSGRRFLHSGPELFFDKRKLADAGPGVYRISFAVKTMEEMQLRMPVIIEGKDGASYAGAGTRLMGPQDGWVKCSNEARVDWKGDLVFVQLMVNAFDSSPNGRSAFYLDQIELTKVE